MPPSDLAALVRAYLAALDETRTRHRTLRLDCMAEKQLRAAEAALRAASAEAGSVRAPCSE